MKPTSPASGAEADLRSLLKTWCVQTPLAPGFKARVWRRIANADAPVRSSPGATFRAWLDRLFARPAWSVGYALVLLSAGLVTGYWQASEQTARWDQWMATRYVQSVDPSFHLNPQP